MGMKTMADDRNAPATKGDIEDLRSEMKEQIGTIHSEMKAMKEQIGTIHSEMKEQVGTVRSEMQESAAMLRSEMQHMHDDFIEQVRDGETRLLDAFYSFAKTDQARHSAHDHETAALKERLAIVESRLTDVERKVNFPDHPPQS
jgi:hypothetical protein